MSKLSVQSVHIGLHACLQAFSEVLDGIGDRLQWHVVSQRQSIFQLGEGLWLRLQFVITFHHAPSPGASQGCSDLWNLIADDVAFKLVLIFVLMINATINNATVKL